VSVPLPASGAEPNLLEQLSRLAVERDGERRRSLLNNVADLFYAPQNDVYTQSEHQVFAALVTRLLRDVDVPGRAAFSERVAPDARTPRDVALVLANDVIEVARPVLVHSPSLSEQDVLNIASMKSTEYRLAISQRPNISENVSDVLIKFGELDVAESLADNQTASISEDGYSRMSRMAVARPGLRHALSRREDLPLVTASEILPYLEPDAAAKLLAMMDVEGAVELQSLIEKATPAFLAERAARARRRINVRTLMTQVASSQVPLNDALSRLIEEGNALDLALGLSLVSGLPERQVTNAIVSVRMEPLAVICRALGVATRIYVAADALRTATVRLPTAPPEILREAYEKLSPETAGRGLRFIKVRNTVATGAP
jgi:uncharacterized protein (DUF2336 family)